MLHLPVHNELNFEHKLLLEVLSNVCLGKTSNSLYKYSEPFIRPAIMRYGKLLNAFKIKFSQFFDKILNLRYLNISFIMLRSKCEQSYSE